MNTKEIAKQILSIAKAEKAEFCEAVVIQNEFSLKRIRQGQVDQPPAGEQWEIDMAVKKNGRKKSLRFDNPIFAQDIIQKAIRSMDMLPTQEIHIPTETFSSVAQPRTLYDKKTAELRDEYSLNIAKKAAKELEKHNLFLSGKIAQGRGEITYQNSLGTAQTALFTIATAALFAFDKKNEHISAYASSGGTSIQHIDTQKTIKELIEKCELQRGKETIDLFEQKQEGEDLKIDIIAEPAFFGPIIQWFGAFGFNGLLVEQGESFISNRLDQQVVGKNISLSDNPTYANNKGLALPFDFEGRPRTAVELLDHGVAKNAAYDTELAHTWNKQATGNALPPSDRSKGALPFDLVMKGEDTSFQDIIASCKKPTLWITKVHYLRMAHYQTATMTGVAQHGIFLIENGQVVAPAENMRFEQSISEALKNVEAMSRPSLYFDPLSFSLPTGVVLPIVKIKQFRFVGSTKRST